MRRATTSVLCACVAIALLVLPAWALDGQTARVSVAAGGAEADGPSDEASPSSDGSVVAFTSEASNLVEDDTNGVADVFVHDRAAGTTTRVSVPSGVGQADGASGEPSISGDGRFVAFTSEASNLVEDDTNGVADVFIHDRQENVTTRASVSAEGTEADGPSSEPAMASDGRDVAFTSEATNLVDDDTNGVADVFAHGRVSGRMVRVSVDSNGNQADGPSGQPAISAGEAHVAFTSEATNLVNGDTNGVADVFVRDRISEVVSRVSVASDGTQANGPSGQTTASASTRFVGFTSQATNLVDGDTNGVADVFVHDTVDEETRRVSVATGGAQADGPSGSPSMGGAGDRVAFSSSASNLTDGDAEGSADVYLHELDDTTTSLVTAAADGGPADGHSTAPAIGVQGTAVAFTSAATNLVERVTNGVTDVYVFAEDPPEPPPGEGCPADDVDPAAFSDRDAIPEAHVGNVDCAAHYDIVTGFQDGTYGPAAGVRRDQMASFIARTLDVAGVTLPAGDEAFTDVPDDSPHAASIGALAEAGIVLGGPQGLPADAYGPELPVRRDQMAAFLIRAAEHATGADLQRPEQTFPDVPASNPHFGNVNGAAEAGLSQGFPDGTYRPGEGVRRGQMASFVVRLLGALVGGTLTPES